MGNGFSMVAASASKNSNGIMMTALAFESALQMDLMYVVTTKFDFPTCGPNSSFYQIASGTSTD